MSITPMMQQYHSIKEKYSNTILFYRMGDFYEMFEQDAVIASKTLGLTLTARNHGGSGKTPLCGFPYHALDRYTTKLINAGLKVAICEQIEDPKQAKGIVKRDVVEVITKGTATNENLLDEKSNNFIVAFYKGKTGVGFSGMDLSTGEFFCAESTKGKLINEFEKLVPSEILYSEDNKESSLTKKVKSDFSNSALSMLDGWNFSYSTAYKNLLLHFKTSSLEGFGVENFKNGIIAAGALFNYVKEQKKGKIGHIKKIAPFNTGQYMVFDGATIRNLELLYPLHVDDKDATLLSVLDKTKTAMGGRLLKRIIINPLLDCNQINKRLDCVGYFVKEGVLRENLRELLAQICDIERLNAKIGYEKVSPRDLHTLNSSLLKLNDIIKLLDGTKLDIINSSTKKLCGTENITEKLELALSENPPILIRDGGIFKEGYSKELDDIELGAKEGKEWIANLQIKEKERTGISSLRVSFNKVFGYYIEVSKTFVDKVPDNYIRKQTLVNGERFITEELKKWEAIVLSAEEKQIKIETKLFDELRIWMTQFLEKLKEVSDSLAIIDCLSSLAFVSERCNYIKPTMEESGVITIKNGRHPVIENLDFTEQFVPNDINIDSKKHFIHLITGPNMAGKSTFLRQTGLIVLLSQIGCFVPADSAVIGVVDRIFTRVGASDRLSKGQSTFLVEMQELANILNNATDKSLVLLDEIGRGTSTFDGLSIAWALVEYIHNNKAVSAKTLFATHYHELTEIPLILKGVKNFNVVVKEWNDNIIFLRKIEEGACESSYGIQVAGLAGVPEKVIKRAKEVLKNLEASELTADSKPAIARHTEKNEFKAEREENLQLSIFDPINRDVLEIIKNINLNTITPLEALNKLDEIKRSVEIVPAN